MSEFWIIKNNNNKKKLGPLKLKFEYNSFIVLFQFYALISCKKRAENSIIFNYTSMHNVSVINKIQKTWYIEKGVWLNHRSSLSSIECISFRIIGGVVIGVVFFVAVIIAKWVTGYIFAFLDILEHLYELRVCEYRRIGLKCVATMER